MAMTRQTITFTTKEFNGLTIEVIPEESNNQIILRFDMKEAIQREPNAPNGRTSQHNLAEKFIAHLMENPNFDVVPAPREESHIPNEIEPRGDVVIKAKEGRVLSGAYSALVKDLEETNRLNTSDAATQNLRLIRRGLTLKPASNQR